MTVDDAIQFAVQKVFKTQFNQFEERLLQKLKPDNLLTVSECMAITKLSRQTILMKIKNNKIKAKIIGNRYRVLESELQTYINNTK
jgi:excisionase family DNA binding protein